MGLGRVRAWAGEGGPVQGEIGPPGRGGGGRSEFLLGQELNLLLSC